MSEMVERVARAIGEIYDGYADPVATPNNWARAEAAARAAIEAMRTPTHAMLDATPLDPSDALVDWQTMIAVALADPEFSSENPIEPPPEGMSIDRSPLPWWIAK